MSFSGTELWRLTPSMTWEERSICAEQFGASLGGPVPMGKHTFFFLNYEGLRHVQADSMTQTFPTTDEVNGAFSMSGVTIDDPATTKSNPNYSPNLPVTAQNPQFTRQPFPDNKFHGHG